MSADTGSDVDARLRALYASRSAGERLRMATSGFGLAKQLARSGLAAGGHQPSGIAERRALLERLYGTEVGPDVILAVANAVPEVDPI